MSITISGDGDINATGNDIELNSTGTTDVTLALGGGSVGIGTASPAALLDLKHNSASTHLRLTENTSGNWSALGVDTSDNLRIYANNSERLRVLSTGGITFNGDTAAANALSDYEEGTFQTNLSPATSGTITIQSTADTLAYTKIGRLVTITGMISVTSTGSAVGSFVLLNNLPFTSADLTEFAGRGAGYVVFDDDSAGTRTPLGTFMLESSTQMRMYINAATVAGSDNFNVSFSYTTT